MMVSSWWLALRDWPWFDTLVTLRQRFREDRLGVTASSLTFTTLMALVPLVTVMLALFSAFPVFGRFEDALQQYFLRALVPRAIAQPVLETLTQFAGQAHRLGALGLVVLVATALALMLTIDHTLGAIWRVREPRPMAQRVLVYWAALTLGPLMVGVSLWGTAQALTVSSGWVGAMPGSTRWLLDAVNVLLLGLTMCGLFRYVPNTHVRWRHALAGALFVVAGLAAAQKGLSWYMTKVGSFSTIYGAFAAVPILLFWIYLAWVIVLLGAVVAAYAPSLQMQVRRPPDVPGMRFALALRLLALLDGARQQGEGGLALLQMAATLRLDPLHIEPVLHDLIALHWVGRLEEEGDQRLVLLVEPAGTPLAPLVAALLLAPQTQLAPLQRQLGWERLSLADALRA